jgi:type I restriction enzyme M protein
VPADAHWREIRKVSRDVGRALQQAMRAIETANPDKLYGIFGDAQWTNKDRLSDAMLRDLIEHFSTLELTVANLPEDELGQGYEYLIKKFADDSGHTAAEFYTNRTVVHLMTEMLDVQPGESVYDPTCGSGGMLLSCIAHLRNQKKEWRNAKLYGQERNLMTSSIARMNCFLHGIEDFRIERGDTLAEPKLVEGDRLQRFDVVLANPPYSIKQWDRDAFASDPWGRNVFGVPPQGRADYAFQQHILQSLKPKTGRCAVLWPHGVLFRQEEADMRRKLIEADLIECVLGLGPNLFYNSPMEACVVVCRTQKPKARRGKILFINAVNEVTRERAQSFLTDEHLQRVVRAYQEFKDEPGFTRVVPIEEIRAKEGNLSIPLYVGGETQAQTDAATETATTALPDALAGWLKSSTAVRAAINQILHTREQEYVIDNYLFEYSKRHPESKLTSKISEFVFWKEDPATHYFRYDWLLTECLVLDTLNDDTIVECTDPNHTSKDHFYDWCLFKPYFREAFEEYRKKLEAAMAITASVETKNHSSLGSGKYTLPIIRVAGSMLTLEQAEMFDVIEPGRPQMGSSEYPVNRGLPSSSNFKIEQELVTATAIHDEQLLAYYFSALKDYSPVSQFKNFYNVLEYFFEEAPVKLGVAAKSEKQQIDAVLRWAVVAVDLLQTLNSLPAKASAGIARARVTSSGEVIPAVNLAAPDIIGEYAAHVYQLRNACIHSKKTRKGAPTPRIAPATAEEEILKDEMSVMQWLAVQCIEKR